MNRLLLVCLLLSTSSFIASSQVFITFPTLGPSNPELRFSSNNYWIEYQFDTTSDFNSYLFRTKICPGKSTDTVMRLKLGRTYYFRSRQIETNGTPINNWWNTQYSTANYPLSNFFTSKQEVNYITYPLHKFTYAYTNKAEFWYDIRADFKSPYLVKTTINNNPNPILLPTFKYDTLYIRSKVYDVYDSLPWKTAILVRDYRPDAYISPNSPCNDSSKFYVDYFYNFNSTFKNNTWKSYISYGNYRDSSINSNYMKSFVLTDNQPVRIISQGQFSEDTFSGSFTDTTYLNDPLRLNSPLSYYIFTTPGIRIRIHPNVCNTGIELELHSDSTYTNLLSKQYKNNTTSGNPLLFSTSWDFYNAYALRYRIIRCGIKGAWFNIPKDAYYPSISHTIQKDVDSSNSTWTINHSNVLTGKTLEVELDINSQFNSQKKKTYRIRDTSVFYLESLFGRINFVRCRIIDGPQSSHWSNVTYKGFTQNSITTAYSLFTQPQYTVTPNVPGFNGFQMLFGHKSNQLKYSIKNLPLQTPDTFDFVDGDTVYYKLRRYTPIDTSSWGAIIKGIYIGRSGVCFTPFILYNGYQNQLDTFHIRWKEKNPKYAQGYQMIFGPAKNNYKGIIDLPKTQFEYTINRQQFPANWYFSVYPACSSPNTYSGLTQDWYPLNGQNTTISEINSNLVFYSQASNSIINNSEDAFQFNLYDNLGRLINSGTIDPNATILLQTIDPGVYHLELRQGMNQLQQKILIL